MCTAVTALSKSKAMSLAAGKMLKLNLIHHTAGVIDWAVWLVERRGSTDRVSISSVWPLDRCRYFFRMSQSSLLPDSQLCGSCNLLLNLTHVLLSSPPPSLMRASVGKHRWRLRICSTEEQCCHQPQGQKCPAKELQLSVARQDSLWLLYKSFQEEHWISE